MKTSPISESSVQVGFPFNELTPDTPPRSFLSEIYSKRLSYVEPLNTFSQSFKLGQLHKTETAFLHGEHRWGVAAYQLLQTVGIIPSLAALIFAKHKYTNLFIRCVVGFVLPTTVIVLSTFFCDNQFEEKWRIIATNINKFVIPRIPGKTLRKRLRLNRETPPFVIPYNIAYRIHKHTGKALQLIAFSHALFNLKSDKQNLNHRLALAGYVVSYLTQINLFTPKVDRAIDTISNALTAYGGLVAPSYLGRIITVITLAPHFFPFVAHKFNEYIDHFLCRNLNPHVPSILQLNKPQQIESVVTETCTLKNYELFPYLDTVQVFVDPSHIGRESLASLPAYLTENLQSEEFDHFLEIWDSIEWLSPDRVHHIVSKLDKDPQFIALMKERNLILPDGSSIDWSGTTYIEIILHARNRLSKFVRAMKGERKLAGDSGDVEELQTNSKIILKQLKILEGIEQEDLLMQVAIDCGSYCADGLRDQLKAIVDGYRINTDTTTMKQTIDTRLRELRNELREKNLAEDNPQINTDRGDVHDEHLLRRQTTRGIELFHSEHAATDISNIFLTYKEFTSEYSYREGFWQTYDARKIYYTFRKLIENGQIPIDDIRLWPTNYAEKRTDWSPDQKKTFKDHMIEIWNDNYTIIPIRNGYWIQINPRILIAILVDMGYLSSTPSFSTRSSLLP